MCGAEGGRPFPRDGYDWGAFVLHDQAVAVPDPLCTGAMGHTHKDAAGRRPSGATRWHPQRRSHALDRKVLCCWASPCLREVPAWVTCEHVPWPMWCACTMHVDLRCLRHSPTPSLAPRKRAALLVPERPRDYWPVTPPEVAEKFARKSAVAVRVLHPTHPRRSRQN